MKSILGFGILFFSGLAWGESFSTAVNGVFCLEQVGEHRIAVLPKEVEGDVPVTPTRNDVAWADSGAKIQFSKWKSDDLERRALLLVEVLAAERGLRQPAIRLFFNQGKIPCFSAPAFEVDQMRQELRSRGVLVRRLSGEREDMNVERAQIKNAIEHMRSQWETSLNEIQTAFLGLAILDERGVYQFKAMRSPGHQLDQQKGFSNLRSKIKALSRQLDIDGFEDVSALTPAELQEYNSVRSVVRAAEKIMEALFEVRRQAFSETIATRLYKLRAPERLAEESLRRRLSFYEMNTPENDNVSKEDELRLERQVDEAFQFAIARQLESFRFHSSGELNAITSFGLLAALDVIMVELNFKLVMLKRIDIEKQFLYILESLASSSLPPKDDLTYRLMVRIARQHELVPIVRMGAAAMAAQIAGEESMKKDTGLRIDEISNLYQKAISLAVMRPSTQSVVLEPYAPAEFHDPVSIYHLYKKIETYRQTAGFPRSFPRKEYTSESSCERLATH